MVSSERSQEIEEALAHQGQQIADLSDMMIAQAKEMDALKLELAKLRGKLEAGDQTSGQQANVRPPHY